MLLVPKTLNVCKLTAGSPSFSSPIFKSAASLIRPQAYRARHKMQRSERRPKHKQSGGELVIDFWLQ